MSLDQDQEEKRSSIRKSALTWGAIVGVIAGLIMLWILGGQSSGIRYGGAIVVALGIGFFVQQASFKSGAKSAECANCGAAFSLSRTDRTETLVSSEPKEDRKDQPDGKIEVTTWTEEVYDVVDTYTCSQCADVTSKSYTTTRRKDEAVHSEQRKKSASDSGTSDSNDPAIGGKKSTGSGRKSAS